MDESKLKWWVLATVMIGTFLGRIDQTIVNLAIPNIINDFSITVQSAGWIATAYIIANAVFVPIWGKLGDTKGRKKVYLWGFIIFIIGSVLAGLSWNLNSMIVFRIIQAIASSADYPTAMAILTVTFREAKEKAQALGIWSASFAAASVFGPLIGGPLIDAFGWRSVFLINLPIGILGILMAYVFIHESTSERKTVEFDWQGSLVLGISLSALVLVLDKGSDWGWLSYASIVTYLLAIVSSIAFYFIEKNHKEPIVDFKFFKNRIFVTTLINNFIVFMGLMGSVFLIPVFAQTFMGYTSREAGYLFIPMAVAFMVGAPIGGKLIGKVKPKYVIAISTLIGGIGIFIFSFLDPRSTALDVIIPLTIMALGMGFGMAQRTSLIAFAVPEHEVGIASSILALARNIAGAFGIAIFATILSNSIENHVLSLAQNTVVHSTDHSVYQKVVGLIILKAQILGYAEVFYVAAFVLVVGAIAALFINAQTKQEERREELMIE